MHSYRQREICISKEYRRERREVKLGYVVPANGPPPQVSLPTPRPRAGQKATPLWLAVIYIDTAAGQNAIKDCSEARHLF